MANKRKLSEFKKVVSAITDCLEGTYFSRINCFEIIAKDVNISVKKLESYLSMLRDYGVLEYSMTDNYIYLTTTGEKWMELAK